MYSKSESEVVWGQILAWPIWTDRKKKYNEHPHSDNVVLSLFLHFIIIIYLLFPSWCVGLVAPVKTSYLKVLWEKIHFENIQIVN